MDHYLSNISYGTPTQIKSFNKFQQTRLTYIKSTNTVAGSLDHLRNWGTTWLVSFLVQSEVYGFV